MNWYEQADGSDLGIFLQVSATFHFFNFSEFHLIAKFRYQMKFANFRNSIFGPKVSQKSRSDPSLCDKPAVIIVSNLPATACISSASRL